MALFFALIWRKPDTEEEDERPAHLRPGEEWMHHHHMTPGNTNVHTPVRRAEVPAPVDDDLLKAAREKRYK